MSKTINEAIIEKQTEGKEVKIYFGSGYEHPAGYITVDMNPSCSDAEVFDDCTRAFPEIADNSVDKIITFHSIEHVGHRRIVPMLMEWRRILKTGGRIVIEAPNLAATIEQFAKLRANSGEIQGDFGDGSVYETLYGGQKDQGSFHISLLTPYQFMVLAKASGFEDYKIKREIPEKGIEYGIEWNLRFILEK